MQPMFSHPVSIKIHITVILSSTPLSSKWLLLQVFQPSICMHISPMHVTGCTHITCLNLVTLIVFVEEWKSWSCLNLNIKNRRTLNKGTLNEVLVGLFCVKFGIWRIGLFEAQEPRKPYIHWEIIKCARLESSLRAWFIIHTGKMFFNKAKLCEVR